MHRIAVLANIQSSNKQESAVVTELESRVILNLSMSYSAHLWHTHTTSHFDWSTSLNASFQIAPQGLLLDVEPAQKVSKQTTCLLDSSSSQWTQVLSHSWVTDSNTVITQVYTSQWKMCVFTTLIGIMWLKFASLVTRIFSPLSYLSVSNCPVYKLPVKSITPLQELLLSADWWAFICMGLHGPCKHSSVPRLRMLLEAVKAYSSL